MIEKAESEMNRRITNLSTTTASLAFFIVGCLFLALVTSSFWPPGHAFLTPLAEEVSALVAASGLVALMWEKFLKRAFFNEVMDKIGLATDVNISGLSGITLDFYHDVNWRQLFKNVKNLDILFSYGGTWRHSHEVELNELAKQRSTSVRVILPNPMNEGLMTQLGIRYGYTGEEMKAKIAEAENDFHKKFDKSPAKLAIHHIQVAPAFNVFRFDDIAIITLFKHRRDRVSVPTFQVKRGVLSMNSLI
jgi:hypothetical protein